MSSISKRVLFLVLVLALASVAWAAQPATDTQPVQAPEVEVDLNLPIIEGELDELFLDPSEVDACCFAECWAVWEECVNACGADTACRQACSAERQACTSQC